MGRYAYAYPFGLGARRVIGGASDLFVAPTFGSVMSPPENGVTASALTAGQVQLTGARTALTGTAGTAAALWGSAQSMYIELELDRDLVDGRNIRCAAVATIGGALNGGTTARAFGLQYVSRTHATTAERGNWYFYIRGESAASAAWVIPVTTMPATARGPFIALPGNDGTNGSVSIYDVSTATWYDSAAVAKPAGFVGVPTITNEIVVLGDGSYVFPRDNSAARQNSNQWIGGFRNLIFANVAMTKAQALEIYNGGDPATVLGGASNLRLHVPGAVNGALSTTKSGTAAAGVTVTPQGALRAGPSMGRQSAANYVTINRMGSILGVNPAISVSAATATVQLSGTAGGTATGTLQVRQVGESGKVYRDWTALTNTGTASNWQAVATLNYAPERCDILVRFSGAPTIIANTGFRHRVVPVIMRHGQSEEVLSTFEASSARALGSATSLNVPLNASGGRVSYGAASWLGAYCRIQSELLAGYLGDEATVIANMVGADYAAHIVVNAISGTSMLALVNDADPSRQWSDTIARCGDIGNRDAAGAIPVFAHIINGWEAFYSGTDGVMKGAYKPFLNGEASADILLADIDHYLRNGEFSVNAPVFITPCNRASAVAAAGATATDASTEAAQRDEMRNAGHLLNYTVGVEPPPHKLQGENAATGALVAATHPEDNDYLGDVWLAVTNAQTTRMALGGGTFPGPVFFETISAGSAANKVRVQLGLPRKQPGVGLADYASGYSTATQSGSYTYALHTLFTTGNAGSGFEARINGGAWSKLNVTGATVIDAALGIVEITLASALSSGQTVEVRYNPGVPGAYSTATITQDNWRAGQLFFNGTALASAPASQSALESIGFAVSGSNQVLSYTAP